VFLGDPPAAAKAAAKAAAAAWAALAAELRPGMTFSQISARGTALLRTMDGGAGLHIPFGPHSVGLAHTEQPEKSLDGNRLDITLITTDGATPIHATGEPILIA
jgi:Xaa-Pro aminopeptidase